MHVLYIRLLIDGETVMPITMALYDTNDWQQPVMGHLLLYVVMRRCRHCITGNLLADVGTRLAFHLRIGCSRAELRMQHSVHGSLNRVKFKHFELSGTPTASVTSYFQNLLKTAAWRIRA